MNQYSIEVALLLARCNSVQDKCSVPHTYNTFGDRSFTAVSPRVGTIFRLITITGPQLWSVHCHHFWRAPLGVRSTKCRHQSREFAHWNIVV